MLQVVSSFVDGFSLPTNTPGAEKNNVPSGATTKSLGVKGTDHCFTVAEVRTAAVAGTLKPTTRTTTKMPIQTETRADLLATLLPKSRSRPIQSLPRDGNSRRAEVSVDRIP